MVLTDEHGNRYKATPAGPKTLEEFYKMEPIEPQLWWEQLPPHTPVEVTKDSWDRNEWVLVRAEDVHQYDYVRWPAPRDNWEYARKCGYTHLVVRSNGFIGMNDDINPLDDAVLVPIPQEAE